MKDEQKIAAVKILRNAQKKHFDKIVHCREYNMKLQEVLHLEAERELGDLAIRMEILFNIGYVAAD